MKSAQKQSIYFSFFRVSTFVGVSILFVVFILLVIASWDVIDVKFLTSNWQHRDITKGGVFPAIVGSLYMGVGVFLFSFPFGIATAIFLTEYNTNESLKRVIHLAVRNLAGVPSVVYGLFGLAVFVHTLNMGTSILAASLTLSIMTLPWIITASVEALEAIPRRFRDASLALGASRWETIKKIVLPTALPGAITGGIVGIARAMGETAPIILVGATFFLTQLPVSPLDKFMALPYHSFILSTQHSHPAAPSYAAATALVLITIVFLLSLSAIITRYHYRMKKDW